MNMFRNKLDLMLEDSDKLDSIILKRIKDHLLQSGGRAKEPLHSGEVTLNHIITAIKNERCLHTSERDLGNTYLEQLVGAAIRKTIPTNYINHAREVFGMPSLPPSELNPKPKEPKEPKEDSPST